VGSLDVGLNVLWALILGVACSGSQQGREPTQNSGRDSAKIDDGVLAKVVGHFSRSVDFDFRLRLRGGVEQRGHGLLRKEGLRLDFMVSSKVTPTKEAPSRIIIISKGRFLDVDGKAMAYSAGPIDSFPLLLAFANTDLLRDLLLTGNKDTNGRVIRIPTKRMEVHLSNDYWIEMLRVEDNELWLTRTQPLMEVTSELFDPTDERMDEWHMTPRPPRFPFGR
jgi:hypothetical protein